MGTGAYLSCSLGSTHRGGPTSAEGPGRSLIVSACALVPAALVWRHASQVMASLGLALVAFMTFSPTFGTQYFAWVAAPVCLLGWRFAAAFNVLCGVLLFHIYDRWSGAWPWNWHRAYATLLSPHERVLGTVVWGLLVVTVVTGIAQIVSAGPKRRNNDRGIRGNARAGAGHTDGKLETIAAEVTT